MRSLLVAFALTVGLFAASLDAAEPPPTGDYVLIDKTVKVFYGQVAGMPGSDMVMQQMIYNQTDRLAATPGISPGNAYAAGAVGGLAGSIMIEASIQAARNRQIAAIRAPLNDGALKDRVLESLSAGLAEAGHPVARRVLAPEAAPNFLRQALGDAKPDYVFMFDGKAGPIISLTADNRRVQIVTNLSVYRRQPNARYAQERTVRLSYLSTSAPEGQDAIAYWATDGAKPVLDAVDDGLRRLVRVAVTDQAVGLSKDAGAEKISLLVDGKTQEIPGKLLRNEDGFVTLAMPYEWVRVLPAELPSLEAPAVPAPSDTASATSPPR